MKRQRQAIILSLSFSRRRSSYVDLQYSSYINRQASIASMWRPIRRPTTYNVTIHQHNPPLSSSKHQLPARLISSITSYPDVDLLAVRSPGERVIKLINMRRRSFHDTFDRSSTFCVVLRKGTHVRGKARYEPGLATH